MMEKKNNNKNNNFSTNHMAAVNDEEPESNVGIRFWCISNK